MVRSHRAGSEIPLGRRDAGEGGEEPAGLRLVGGHGGEEAALDRRGRPEGGEAEREVVHAADGPVAAALMVTQRVVQRPARTRSPRSPHRSSERR